MDCQGLCGKLANAGPSSLHSLPLRPECEARKNRESQIGLFKCRHCLSVMCVTCADQTLSKENHRIAKRPAANKIEECDCKIGVENQKQTSFCYVSEERPNCQTEVNILESSEGDLQTCLLRKICESCRQPFLLARINITSPNRVLTENYPGKYRIVGPIICLHCTTVLCNDCRMRD